MEEDDTEQMMIVVGLDRPVRVPQRLAHRVLVEEVATHLNRVAPRERIRSRVGQIAVEANAFPHRRSLVSDSDNRIDGDVDRNGFRIQIRVAMHRSNYAFAGACKIF